MIHLVPPILPPLIDDERFNRNGMVPNAALLRRVADGMNFISHRCKKQVFLRCQAMNNVDGGGSAAELLWPVYFRTGEVTNALQVVAGLCLSDFDWKGAALSPPEFKITVKDAAGATVETAGWTFGGTTASATVAPDDMHFIQDTITGLDPNTAYYLVIETLSGARAVFCSIAELQSRYADDTQASVCSPNQLLAEGPIYDTHVQDLIGASNALWRHSGAHLIAWTMPYSTTSGSVSVVSATTYTNVIDTASTSVAAGTPGWNLFTQYHNTVSRTSIPVVVAFNVNRTAGAGTLDLKLTDGTNTVSITGISGTPATDGWTTAAATIPVQNGTKWDLHGKVSAGGTTYEVRAAMLYEYEA